MILCETTDSLHTSGTRWLFQRTKEATISSFGGNTSASLEESRQRQIIAKADLKGKLTNPLFEASRPQLLVNSSVATPEMHGKVRQDDVRSRPRPQTAMARTSASAPDDLTNAKMEDQGIDSSSTAMGQDAAKLSGQTGGMDQSGRPRPQSAMSIRSGLKQSLEANGSVQVRCPLRRCCCVHHRPLSRLVIVVMSPVSRAFPSIQKCRASKGGA